MRLPGLDVSISRSLQTAGSLYCSKDIELVSLNAPEDKYEICSSC